MYTKSEATIANIFDSAEQLFVAGNFASVSMQDIAAKANVTKGALYHHFDSKEDLYTTMLCRDLASKEKLLSEAIDGEGSAHHRLSNLTRCYLELPTVKRQLIQLVRRDINCFDGQTRGKIIRAYQATLPDLIESVLRDGIETGEIIAGDARLLAWSYISLVEVTLTTYAESLFYDVDEILNHVLNLFFKGAGASTT